MKKIYLLVSVAMLTLLFSGVASASSILMEATCISTFDGDFLFSIGTMIDGPIADYTMDEGATLETNSGPQHFPAGTKLDDPEPNEPDPCGGS